jgi:large subunit ribosomal protein L10
MPTERKIQQVAELEDQLNRCMIAISLDYRGLTVSQMQQLRRTLREIEPTTEMRVVKNTMLKRAAENSGTAALLEVVEEATALVFGYEDEVSAAKGLDKFARDNRIELVIRGGLLDGAVIDRAQIDELAKVPGRLELMARLAGGLSSPITGIAGGIHSLIREVAAVVEARAAQLEAEGGDVAPEASAEAEPADADAEEASSDGSDASSAEEAAPSDDEASDEAGDDADAAEASSEE